MGSLSPPLPGRVCSGCGRGDLCLEASLALLEDKDQDLHRPTGRGGHRGQGALGPDCELRGQLLPGVPPSVDTVRAHTSCRLAPGNRGLGTESRRPHKGEGTFAFHYGSGL